MGGHFIRQSVTVTSDRNKIWRKLSRVLTEHFPEDFVGNVWLTIPGRVESNAAIPEFMRSYREGRHKASHDTLDCIHRNGPYSKESQDVIDPERVEISAHLAEPAFPPFVSVLFHPGPVVSWKTPVLPLYGKIIRRGTSLHAQVEKCRLHPGLHTMSVDTDGDISLKDDAMSVGIVMCTTQLSMQQKLSEQVKACLPEGLASGFTESAYLFLVKFRIFFPMFRIRTAMLFTQMTESGIGSQPVFIVAPEFRVCFTIEYAIGCQAIQP